MDIKHLMLSEVLLEPTRNGLTKPKGIRGRGYKMISMGEIFSQSRITNCEMDRVPVTEKEYESSKIQKDDLLFARQSLVLEGAGKCCIVVDVQEPTVFESHLIRVRVDKCKANPYFVYYYFNSWLGREHIKTIVEQVAAAGIRGSDLVRLKIPFPDLNIQNRIVDTLMSIDEKIELNEQINHHLEQTARAIFKSWFVDFEPFDEQLIDTPFGGKAPASLTMKQIADIPHVLETGRRPKGGAVASGIPSIGAENVKELGVVNFASAKYIPTEFAAKMKTGAINGYELLLYKDGGKPGTFTPHFSMFGEGFPYASFYINEHVFKLDFHNPGYNIFAYFYMQTDYPYSWLASNGGKAAIPGINQQDVNAIWMFAPDHPKVIEFCTLAQPLFKAIFTNCAQNMKLATLRDTLLPRLMSGDLSVADIADAK